MCEQCHAQSGQYRWLETRIKRHRVALRDLEAAVIAKHDELTVARFKAAAAEGPVYMHTMERGENDGASDELGKPPLSGHTMEKVGRDGD